jgi:testis-specific serine kinase
MINTRKIDYNKLIQHYMDTENTSDLIGSYHQPRFVYKTYEQILEEHGYKLGKTLGKGSYAKVKYVFLIVVIISFVKYYFILELREAREINNNRRKVAIKIIDRKRAPEDFLNKFLPREQEIYDTLNHPNIIKKFNNFEISHKVFIVMEIAEGGDLLDFIKVTFG